MWKKEGKGRKLGMDFATWAGFCNRAGNYDSRVQTKDVAKATMVTMKTRGFGDSGLEDVVAEDVTMSLGCRYGVLIWGGRGDEADSSDERREKRLIRRNRVRRATGSFLIQEEELWGLGSQMEEGAVQGTVLSGGPREGTIHGKYLKHIA